MASGTRYSTPAGLGSVLSRPDWPGCFANFPVGVGASVAAGAWAPGSSGARPGFRLQLEASRSGGHVLLPGAGAGARGGGGRLAGEGGRGGPRWGSGVRVGLGARVARRCTVLGGGDARGAWAGGHLFAGAVWGASAGHPVLGEPEVGLGLEPGDQSATPSGPSTGQQEDV